MLYIFTGDGKGKTSAGLGLLARAYGAGLTCAIIFFDKNPAYGSELKTLEKIDLPAFVFGENRIEGEGRFRFGNTQKDLEAAEEAFKKAWELLLRETDVLVLDEFLNAIRLEQIPLERALEFIDRWPKDKHLILTGRGLPQEIESRADMISEIRKVRHPFDRGQIAERGIDY